MRKKQRNIKQLLKKKHIKKFPKNRTILKRCGHWRRRQTGVWAGVSRKGMEEEEEGERKEMKGQGRSCMGEERNVRKGRGTGGRREMSRQGWR